jgi:hypothetical protein
MPKLVQYGLGMMHRNQLLRGSCTHIFVASNASYLKFSSLLQNSYASPIFSGGNLIG